MTRAKLETTSGRRTGGQAVRTSPRRLARAAEIVRVLARCRAGQLLRSDRDDETSRARAVRLREGLEELGPTFCKLGQLLSTRPDLLPLTVVEELSSLRSQVRSMEPAEMLQVVDAELGVPWRSVFTSVDTEPLAAGTVGQVHRARLRDGRRVVLKVQRPSAARTVERDLALLGSVTAAVQRWVPVVDLAALVRELTSSLTAELDFDREAANLRRMAGLLAGFRRLGVPRVHTDISSARLLVMDEVCGAALSDLEPGDGRVDAAADLLAAFVHQLLAVGFFHADPHPGNLLWSQGRVWLVDFGLVGEIDRAGRRRLGLLMLSFWHGDAEFVADLVLGMTPPRARARLDRPAFTRDIEALIDTTSGRRAGTLEVGEMIQRIVEISVRHRVPVPTELALVGKTLSELQYSLTLLDPELDLFESARRQVVRELVLGLVKDRDVGRLGYELVKVHHRTTHALEALIDGRSSVGTEPLRRRAPRHRSARSLVLAFAGGCALASSTRTAPGARRRLVDVRAVAAVALAGALLRADRRV